MTRGSGRFRGRVNRCRGYLPWYVFRGRPIQKTQKGGPFLVGGIGAIASRIGTTSSATRIGSTSIIGSTNGIATSIGFAKVLK